jgi:2-iminobutanoate/2-iminopropanoate deaminase
MSHRIIATEGAPAAIGPYSQGVVAGGLLYTAMQISLDPASGELIGATAAEQAAQCLRNIVAIVAAAGGVPADVVKTSVYLTDLNEFAAVNDVYAEFFGAEPPARGVAEVAALPKGALVAVEAVAAID